MDKTSEETCIKQRRTHISKSVESFQNLMSSSDANLTDLNRLIFDQNDTKKLIDKHQQTNSSNNYSLTIENICWFVLSIVSIYVSDIFRVLMYDSRINRWDFFYWCSYHFWYRELGSILTFLKLLMDKLIWKISGTKNGVCGTHRKKAMNAFLNFNSLKQMNFF